MPHETSPTGQAPVGLTAPAPDWPPELAGLLWKAEVLLQQRRAGDALDLLIQSKRESPWLANAAAACRLRLGDADGAVQALRRLVMMTNGVTYRDDVPALFKANFAAALLAAGNLSGGLRALAEMRDEAHPAAQHLRDAVSLWEGGMTGWQKLWWSVLGEPPRPLVLGAPVGWIG